MLFVAANTSITERKIHNEIIINASASRVWQILTYFEAYPEWNPFIRQLTGVVGVGEQLTVQMHTGDHTMTFQPTILAVKPERELHWLGLLYVQGMFDGEHTFTIEPLGENKVRFIQQEEFKGLLVPFSGSLLESTNNSFGEMNQALKKRAEQTSEN
jgi:hypothetical protein